MDTGQLVYGKLQRGETVVHLKNQDQREVLSERQGSVERRNGSAG